MWSGKSRGMARPRRAPQVRQDQVFKGRQFTAEVILWAVRWYLMFPVSYRDLELMLMDRGVEVDVTLRLTLRIATSLTWRCSKLVPPQSACTCRFGILTGLSH
jgi:hypothetical protein